MKRVMKRALADRAKLELPQGPPPSAVGSSSSAGDASTSGQNGNRSVSHVSSTSESQPPLKLQRITSEDPASSGAPEGSKPTCASSRPQSHVTPVTSAVTSSVSFPPSPRTSRTSQQSEHARSNHTASASGSHKRPRRETLASHAQHQSEQETDSSSAFYLQHQNRALAVELKSLQDQVRELTQEREYRRKSCLQAVQALHSLQATWTSLETALGQEPPPAPPVVAPSSPSMTSSTVGNTDETAVEWTTALHRALRALGGAQRKREALGSEPDDPDSVESNGRTSIQRNEMMNMGEMAANITGRANCLQEWLWRLLRSKQLDHQIASAKVKADNGVEDGADHEKKRAETEEERARLQAQVEELIQCRDDLILKERRLRRNIYRLDVGMITQKQLIQSVAANVDSPDDDPERMAVQKEAIFRGVLGGGGDVPSATTATKALAAAAASPEAGLSAKVVLDLQNELDDSRREVANREKSIKELNERIRELQRRVNELCLKQQSDGDREKLECFESTSLKLRAAEKEVKELAEKLAKTREKWAQSAGNEKALAKALEELEEKHQKRWNELTASEEAARDNGGVVFAEEQARKIAELEHKLCQALENVRQAETARSNLRDALLLNESLQATVEELKDSQSADGSEKPEKNERNSSRASGDSHATPSASKGESHGDSKSHSDSKSHHHRESSGSERISSEKAEKIYRENKKMRKEIAAILASKESHKAKLERVERERNSLVDVNARLLRQASEKDEMNAKSLSSILHLKSLTEQLTQQRDNLEQQLKSAEQLALAARLATNSKDRLHEELVREKTALEEDLRNLEKRHDEMKKDLSQKTAECADVSGKTSSLRADLVNATKRCDEFVATVEEQKEESRKLLDALEKAERQAKEAREKLAEMAKSSEASGSDSGSGFTSEQLKTQIQVLKNRLACPVCHYRDKECIIMRCRHMHCKQCVEERLANRSRRCPTCNNPFGRNDMEDIFLG